MGCEKAGLVLLLLTLEGLLATGPARAHSAPGVETPQKALSTDYYCDFDNADRPFCDWSAPPDSQWLRERGQRPGESPGPPEGDIARRDYYIYPAAGPFAQLESPEVDLAGAEVCVRFLYYLYSLSMEGQLSVEIRDASGSVAPLWTRRGMQSASWLSGAVTVPAQAQRPFKVVFRAKQISTNEITLAVDSIFIQLGPCSPCVTKCDFDNPTDLCGWSNPEEGDVAWGQWSGPTNMPGVGPSDDFSRPGVGSFMLLDSFDEATRGSGFLKSPTFNSSGGCLRLTFRYTLHGVSNDTALKIYAAPPGGDLGVPLLTLRGEHGPDWRGSFANYTGKGDIQFVFEGVYAGEPSLAVDNVAISPCEDIFASCDFNNNMDPFCGWSASVNETWRRTNQSTPTEDTGPPGDFPHGEGYYIYVEGGHLKPNESTRFSSPSFCMNQESCVEFYYHMHSIVEVETQLRVLLEEPSGSTVLLWNRTGSQGPSWLYGSARLPYGGAQPSKITFEVVRGRNAYLDVSLDNISVHKGLCAGHPATPAPPSTNSTAPPTAEGPAVTVPPEHSTISQPTTPSAPTATKSTGTQPHPATLSSTAPSTRPVAVTTSTPVPTRNASVATTPVPPITTTEVVLPNITLPSGAASTPKLTTSSLQPTTGIPRPSRPSSPSSTTSNHSTAQGTLTTTLVPPITTTKDVLPNITLPSGAASTPKLTSLQPSTGTSRPSRPPSPSSTTSKSSPSQVTPVPSKNESLTSTPVPPITTTTGSPPNITIPAGTNSTPKLTTSLPPATGTSKPNKPSSPSYPLTGSTTSKSSTSQGAPSTTPVPPVSTTKTVLPNITPPSGTSSTPKLTTSLQPTSGTSRPSQPPTSSSTLASSTTTKCSTGQDIPVPTRNESLSTTPVPPTSTTKAALPDITIHPGAASTPKLTTSLQPTSGTSKPSQPSTSSSTTSKSSTTQGTQSTTPVPSIHTTTATLPNITVPSGAASTPKLTTSLQPPAGTSGPRSTLTSSTTSKSPPSHPPLVTPVPTRNEPLSSTPVTPTKVVLPNITVPSGTTKLTTSLQPPTGTSRPDRPPSSTPSPQPSGPTITQPLLTDPVNTPKPTPEEPSVDQATPEQLPDSAPCVVSGDPHYTTYDGRLFHFMGNCTYLLTATCNATPDQPTFQIQTTNEHRGSNTKVSYLKSVNVTVYGTQIVLLKARRVTVDGKRVTLPVSVVGGQVSVRLSGTFVRVQTDFGLSVRFDGNHHAEVSVPSSYFGKLCGLCGNFNGQAGDDNLMPNGTSAGTDDNQLGKSWLVPNIGDASCTDSKDPEECNPDIAAEAQGPTSCGILTDPKGPFAPCHGKVAPEGAFENCFYDLCETDGDAGMLCFALQAYADRCAQAGVTIVWRNSTFCPLSCPPGSSYSSCGPACPATCTDAAPRDSCPALPCVEGCVCDQGFVLSGDQCVPLDQCGCTDADGHYHVVGESWMGDLNCTQRCSCAAGDNITCEGWSCSPVQECRPVDGLLGCQDTGVATCHVAGDPHYYTFDLKMVSFMGTCTYTLVALCQQDPRLPFFNITAKNEERGQPEASYLRHVTVYVQGVTITLQKSRRVLIDGQRVRVPAEGRIPGVSIVPRGIYVVIETNFGLVVKFDGNHHLEIQLPGTYFGKVCGMCGNYNNQSTDDYLMPNGHLAVNDSQFGNSWKAPGDADAGCQPDNRPDSESSCSRQELERLGALCMEIMAPKYQACHSLIDPKLFFQNCLYDMCQYQGMASVLCDNIQAYVEACRSHGVAGISWRNSTFCPLPCPPDSHFSECASPCPATCSNLYAPASCHYPTPCVEGCACDRGYVLSDLTCVPMRECGCRDHQQEYHNNGDTWVTSGCQQRCICLGGQIQCQPFSCPTGSLCSTSTEGLHYCRPTTFHQCVISGDPHYRTFDNFVHHFQGRCTYTLTQTLGRLPEGLEPVSVAGRNHRRSILHRVSFLRELYVEVLGFQITLMQGRKMAVNGVRVTPPYSPTEGLQITQRGRRLIVQTNFGFSLSYDGQNGAEIVLPSTYQKRVGGLCGNYDGRRNNEYMKPDGTLARTLNAFGNSWQVSVKNKELDGGSGKFSPGRVRRQEPDEEPESGFEMDCTPGQLAVVNGTKACGVLSDPAGPFSACHAAVSPAPFQEGCVYDLCALFNDTELLCQALEAYAQLCQEEKVDLGRWRQDTGCPMACPAHTNYQPCMTACPASCANMAAPSSCEAPCVEGCASAPGYVLSGLVNVPYDQCGCLSHGQYYQVNETFMTEDCSQRCTCRPGALVECLPTGCRPGEVCAVSNYARNCFKDDACLSSPCQNEGTCQVTSGGFLCLCLEGYVGSLCQDSPLESPTPAPPVSSTPGTSTTQAPPEVSLTTDPGDPGDPDLLAILLGIFIPLAVILLALIIFCVCRQRNIGYKIQQKEDRVSIISTSGFAGL
ncbi:zonadhesin [Crotalus tigris]|uniref:zonadhesin n=1 Tax=Crotalus tigris TaxID=88082 RepID=UPI00192F9846|nr:zonadhesin [Crotalus tigris]